MSSVTSAESESSPRPDKCPALPAQSPQPKWAHPFDLSLGNSASEGDNPPTNAGEQSSVVSGSPRIQLPSSQPVSLPGIVRPNSTSGPIPSANAPLNYDDNLRHSSLGSSYTFPPAYQAPNVRGCRAYLWPGGA
ncbi:hypothetical protein BJV78DRAFT_552507 [Lactifluus subvellereus]|nr:hypothetical protein BJV78DRAFT_552507 [Lactifluus subvellereus]